MHIFRHVLRVYMNDGLKSKNFGYLSTVDRLKGNDIRLKVTPQISNRGRLLPRSIKGCRIEGQRIHYKCTKFLHNIANKERDWWIKFLTFVDRWSAVFMLLIPYLSLLDICGSPLRRKLWVDFGNYLQIWSPHIFSVIFPHPPPPPHQT